MKLSVEVDEKEFDKALDAAFRKIAREVRIPGFRPGKAPRKVLEARLGKNVGRGQALEEAIPTYYVEAVKEHDVDVIAQPEIELTGGQEEGAVQFDAVVEVRPAVTVPGYQNLRVTVPAPVPSADDIDSQIDTLRSRFAELEAVDRPATDDDVVTINIAGRQGGDELSGLTADDFSYEVGSGQILPEVDERLRGAKVGDMLQFEVMSPGGSGDDDDDRDRPDPIEIKIFVKDIKTKVLPELDDEFASEASEFETLAELRDDLTKRMTAIKQVQGTMALREQVGEALADLVEEDVPEALVNVELSNRVQDLAMRLGAQGVELGQWLQASNKDEEELLDELRGPAERAAKVDLALRAVAEAQDIECTDDDLDVEWESVAKRLELKPAEVRRRFEREGQVQAVRSDVNKRKAFEWLLERVEIVDPDGNPLDRSAFELSGPSDETDSDETDSGELETEDETPPVPEESATSDEEPEEEDA